MKTPFVLLVLLELAICLPSLAAEKTARFAGGCFWSMQKAFDKLKDHGVLTTTVGYSGGTKENPSYRDVSSGSTGHRETVQVTYDPAKIGFTELSEYFLRHIDPTDPRGQICDYGDEYRTAIFFEGGDEKADAEKAIQVVSKGLKTGGKVVTQLLPAKKFYPAEEYHQEYYLKNPTAYDEYRVGCGRDEKLKEIWGKVP